jgi:flagellar basal-body rod modification protein FlgD
MGSAVAAIHAHSQAIPMSSTADSGTTNADGSTISANDFLTLLVTEMKNQDPTAQTDPNEYINQLVQVNSLEQLIQINQNLGTALGGTPTGGVVSGSGRAMSAGPTPGPSAAIGGQTVADQSTGDSRSATFVPAAHGLPVTSGNLGLPQPMPAAQRVAQALSGR